MKKLFGILVLGLLWSNVGISGENKFTVKELNINLPSEYECRDNNGYIIKTSERQYSISPEILFN